jgi:hypothetical protein
MADKLSAPRPAIGMAAYAAWIICAVFVGLAADIMQPRGSFVLFLAMVFVVVAIVAALLSFLPVFKATLRAAAFCALLSAVVFAGFAGLQRYLSPQPAGVQRGFIAALLPPARGFQRFVLAEAEKREPIVEEALAPKQAEPIAAAAATPVTPPAPPPLAGSAKTLADLTAALASPDPAERLRSAINALADKDPAASAAVIDRLYRSNDPALRQLAVAKLLSQRRGARIPLLAVSADAETTAFANALQGVGVTIRTINEQTGAFEGGLCGPAGMNGAVNRNGVTMAGRCKLGDGERTTLLVLQATDDFRLTGEARNDAGQAVKVELPLM